jgi:hypothetical protein
MIGFAKARLCGDRLFVEMAENVFNQCIQNLLVTFIRLIYYDTILLQKPLARNIKAAVD